MRFDEYSSESKALLEGLRISVRQREESMLICFIQQGPEVLRRMAGVQTDADWQMVFDRLVFSGQVLKKCVVDFMPFFKHMVVEHGPFVLRKIFNIEASKYDRVFLELFELVAIANGGLYDYVYRNRYGIAQRIREGRAGDLRLELGLKNDKYNALWGEILGILSNSVCEHVNTETTLEKGLQTFSLMMNNVRSHRSLRSYRKMWEFEA